MKKRSAAKPPDPVFFIDRSLGRRDVPEALTAAGYQCEIHDDHFPRDTPDEVWLRELAQREWVVLTKDERIRYRPLERAALRDSGLCVFIAVCGNVTGEETARVLVRAMPRICKVLETSRKRPLLAYVYRSGLIKVT